MNARKSVPRRPPSSERPLELKTRPWSRPVEVSQQRYEDIIGPTEYDVALRVKATIESGLANGAGTSQPNVISRSSFRRYSAERSASQ